MPVGSLALAWELKVLNHITGHADIGTLPTVYIALFTVAPTGEDGTGGTEASAGNYVRKLSAVADWNDAAAGHIDNANDITFVECSGANWGTINGFALFTTETAGEMIAWGNVTSPKTINIGDTAKFAAGELDITLD